MAKFIYEFHLSKNIQTPFHKIGQEGDLETSSILTLWMRKIR
jgi:hypothetical protein